MDVNELHDRNERFERAFVAVCYLLGTRGEHLYEPLGSVEAGTRQLLAGLRHASRDARASVLAAELGQIARSLERRWLA